MKELEKLTEGARLMAADEEGRFTFELSPQARAMDLETFAQHEDEVMSFGFEERIPFCNAYTEEDMGRDQNGTLTVKDIENLIYVARNINIIISKLATGFSCALKLMAKKTRMLAISLDPTIPRGLKDVRIWQLEHEPKKQRTKKRT